MSYDPTILKEYSVLSDPNISLNRQIRSIVSSYNSSWDPLTELVQNAVDAINQRAGSEGAGFKGTILITIDADDRTVTIEDNGIGIQPNNRNTMILPGGSLKTQGNTYGHKGLGFTYCAHIVDYIEVDTWHEDGKEHWNFSGGFEWLVDPNVMTKIKSIDENLRSLDEFGTAVRMRLMTSGYEEKIANTAVLDKFFEWANDEKLMPFILRTRTAIGQVGWIYGESVPEIEVKLRFTSSDTDVVVPCEFFNFMDYPPLNQQVYPKATEYMSKIYNNPRNMNKIHHGIYHVFDQDLTNPGQPLRVGRNRGGVHFKGFLYACGKKNLQEALKQYDPRLGDEFKELAFKTDVHLSIAGMPCGVPIDSWNNYGHHEQRYFAMLDTEMRFGTVLDAGRKTITRHYVDLLVNKLMEMAKSKSYFSDIASFQEMSHQLHHSASLPQQRGPIHYIERWKDLEALPSSSLLLERIPDDEIGVYIIFAELVGLGFLPGFRILYVSGGAVYDSAFEFSLDLNDPSNVNPTVDGGQSALGVGSVLVQRHGRRPYKYQHVATGQEHLVVEFKVDAHDLLRDIQKRRSEKDISHINILICMKHDADEITKLGGAVTPVSDAAREFSGVTHTLAYGPHAIQLICLNDLIEKLINTGSL